MTRFVAKLERLLEREDFRASPARAILRRLWWRLRWAVNSRPWRLETPAGFPLWIGKTGSGALIYYQGVSEPGTARFLSNFLREGMIVADAGAHFGEFTVLAARRVGPTGQVHAFEPHAEMFALLERNVADNRPGRVTLNRCAVADFDGEATFWERAEPASSSLASGGASAATDVRRMQSVPVRRLDSYFADYGLIPDLIKADVEGAERRVVLGATGLCSLPPERAPVWLLEYSITASARAGEAAQQLPRVLEVFGYRCYLLVDDGTLGPWAPPGPPEVATVNLVASKRELH
ncbi:MAG: FkbM family methyltransferase [Bryobacteraceae bacterium]